MVSYFGPEIIGLGINDSLKRKKVEDV